MTAAPRSVARSTQLPAKSENLLWAFLVGQGARNMALEMPAVAHRPTICIDGAGPERIVPKGRDFAKVCRDLLVVHIVIGGAIEPEERQCALERSK